MRQLLFIYRMNGRMTSRGARDGEQGKKIKEGEQNIERNVQRRRHRRSSSSNIVTSHGSNGARGKVTYRHGSRHDPHRRGAEGRVRGADPPTALTIHAVLAAGAARSPAVGRARGLQGRARVLRDDPHHAVRVTEPCRTRGSVRRSRRARAAPPRAGRSTGGRGGVAEGVLVG